MSIVFLLVPGAILVNHLKSCIPRPVHEIQTGVSKFIFIIAIGPGSNLVKPGQLDGIAGDEEVEGLRPQAWRVAKGT